MTSCVIEYQLSLVKCHRYIKYFDRRVNDSHRAFCANVWNRITPTPAQTGGNMDYLLLHRLYSLHRRCERAALRWTNVCKLIWGDAEVFTDQRRAETKMQRAPSAIPTSIPSTPRPCHTLKTRIFFRDYTESSHRGTSGNAALTT